MIGSALHPRGVFVWLHRYVGLALAGFLLIEGLTGALLAFNGDLSRALDPRFVAAKPPAGARRLSLAALAMRAEALEPTEHVAYFGEYSDERAIMRMWGRRDPATGGRYPDVPFTVALDPWTGERLGEKEPATAWARFLASIMPFARDLHYNLTFGQKGEYVLLAVALIWTIDCFVAFYLTLPISLEKFRKRWKPSWLVKWRGGFYRINFDLHRAGGLWLWAMLLVFAWSSVQLVDRIGVYDWAMARISDYQGDEALMATLFTDRSRDAPFALDWMEAQAAGERLMAQEAAREGFKIVRPVALNRFEESRLYNYTALTDRPFPRQQTATVFFDADTGAMREAVDEASGGGHWGDALTFWLRGLHMARDPLDYFVYRVFIVVAGLVVAMLSITGVYIWWKKRRARKSVARAASNRQMRGAEGGVG
jgi:uncharacterized iron-regulated membrane protein